MTTMTKTAIRRHAKGDADLSSDDKKGVFLDKDDDGEAVRIAAVLSLAAFM